MSVLSRALIGSVGLGFAVAGLIAVFVKDTNVAGVPLLVVAGAAFLYVALTGQRLIQVTKDGVTFGKAARLAKTLKEVNNDPDISDGTKARIAEVAEDNGILLARPSEFELEQNVRAMLVRLGRHYGFDVRDASRDVRVDFYLVNPHNRTVGVEVRARLRVRQFAEAIRTLRTLDIRDRILVVDGTIPSDFGEAFEPEGIWVVGWGPESYQAFEATLRRMEFLTD